MDKQRDMWLRAWFEYVLKIKERGFLMRREGKNVKKRKVKRKLNPRVELQYLGYLNYVQLNMDAN